MGLRTAGGYAPGLQQEAQSKPERARKKLNLFDATMLVMGGIIGVGIFFKPHEIAEFVPQSGPMIALWVFAGLVALAGALTFAELGGSFPRTGGWYVFLREAFGRISQYAFSSSNTKSASSPSRSASACRRSEMQVESS